MSASTQPDGRADEVRRALEGALDPELDRSVVELDFIDRIAVDGADVLVEYRLPTYWCSANFAWIMSEDMRAAVSALSWTEKVEIRLVEHFAAERINRGVASGVDFGEAFGAEAGGNLGALRETFRQKAYLGRMSALIDRLRAAGRGDRDVAAMTIADLGKLEGEGIGALAARHLQMRRIYGGPYAGDRPAFATVDGARVGEAELAGFLRDIRMMRRGVEANGELCRAYLKARREAPIAEINSPEPAWSGR
jgi:metal-sulfur cluster biosynthetic enzyme